MEKESNIIVFDTYEIIPKSATRTVEIEKMKSKLSVFISLIDRESIKKFPYMGWS